MQLATYEFGEATDQPSLLIVHGLFGSGRNWRAIAKRLSGARKVITVDLRNHGDSSWNDDHSYDAMAEDLIDVMNSIDGPVDLLGHSMGGKAAMVAALKGARVNRLLVADIAPVTYQHDQSNNVAIMKNLPLDQVTSRREADSLMAKQLDDAATRAFFLQSLDFSDTPPRWVLNLDALDQNMDQIIGFPALQTSSDVSTLFLRGTKSHYVADAHWQSCLAHFPNAALAQIDAGHWLHAEAPGPFIAAVENFLSQN